MTIADLKDLNHDDFLAAVGLTINRLRNGATAEEPGAA